MRRFFSYFTMVRHDTNQVAEWPKLDRFQIAESIKNRKSIIGADGGCSRVDSRLFSLFFKMFFLMEPSILLFCFFPETSQRRHYLKPCIRGALSATCVQCAQLSLPKVEAGERRDYILLYARIKGAQV